MLKTVKNWSNRKMHGNEGRVIIWTDTTVENTQTKCRALVRDDGKILSTRDCWDLPADSLLLPKNKGRIIEKTDGPYLVEMEKRYEA